MDDASSPLGSNPGEAIAGGGCVVADGDEGPSGAAAESNNKAMEAVDAAAEGAACAAQVIASSRIQSHAISSM